MGTSFEVTRVTVEITAGNEKRVLQFTGNCLPNALFFSPKDWANASPGLSESPGFSLKPPENAIAVIARIEERLQDPNLVKHPGSKSFLTLHDCWCDWWSMT